MSLGVDGPWLHFELNGEQKPRVLLPGKEMNRGFK